MTILILAGGEAPRWKGILPKELALIAGQPLLQHTVEQVKHRGSPWIITHKPEIGDVVGFIFEPQAHRWWPEALLSTQDIWFNSVVVLNGDVVFSAEALDRIFSGGLHVYGQRTPSWEIFAVSFDSEDYKKVVGAAKEAIERGEKGHRCTIWEFYRALSGLDLADQYKFDDVVWCEINDFTTDFDTLKHYEEFLRSHPWAQ